MATENQIHANRKNALHSTGPRTESGKAVSARNALTLGLFTKSDYVRPNEQSEYNDLCARCVTEINPAGVLEETFVIAIISARWRLRRCSLVERQLVNPNHSDPMVYAYDERIQNSVDRARSHASLLLRLSILELRRLQTDRAITRGFLSDEQGLPALAHAKQIVTLRRRPAVTKGQDLSPQNATAHPNQWSSGSFCSTPPQTPRNAACHCGSGEKFKRCCGKDAPPVLGPGASPVTNPGRKAA